MEIKRNGNIYEVSENGFGSLVFNIVEFEDGKEYVKAQTGMWERAWIDTEVFENEDWVATQTQNGKCIMRRGCNAVDGEIYP